jgi:ferredoxin
MDSKTNKEVPMARKVYIDQEECIGCGTCEEICPEVFRLNTTTDKAEVINASAAPENKIEEAIESCPVECIHWEE